MDLSYRGRLNAWERSEHEYRIFQNYVAEPIYRELDALHRFIQAVVRQVNSTIKVEGEELASQAFDACHSVVKTVEMLASGWRPDPELGHELLNKAIALEDTVMIATVTVIDKGDSHAYEVDCQRAIVELRSMVLFANYPTPFSNR